MNLFRKNRSQSERIAHEAASWILRRDRGLSATEQDEFSQWLAVDSRHGACFARQRQNWDRLNQLALWGPEHGTRPNRDLLAPPPRSSRRTGNNQGIRWVAFSLSAAAAIAIGLFVAWPRHASSNPDTPVLPLATIQQRTLEDGSIIELNRGAEVGVLYTPSERRVRLKRGEAHFTVAKNPERPFIVSAGGVDVRAVGTAFDVRLDPATVSVLVTEGHVRVNRPAASAIVEPAALAAGQRAVVSLNAAAPLPEAVAVSASDMERLLAWQPRLLDFVSEPLSGIVGEFNRHNPVQIVVSDPSLGSVPISASFRSDNVEGFVRLLETGFDVQAVRAGNTITLRKAR